ncbi:MAG: exodeoxyribonuclease VII small subunit [Proteobacteria bacterium]|nr:exodeoxyribonuclease VII small subunit [Pseudomonadota bacterium]
MANKKSETPVPDFEGTLKKLDSLVEKLEGGELTLEQALKHFEEGVTLARQCQQALRQAEFRVQELISESPNLDSSTEE